jgi:hypothetical protein
MKKSILMLLLLVAVCLASSAQSKDTTKDQFTYDTTITQCMYTVDYATGATTTSWCYKITKSKFDFVNPTADEFKKDSFTVRKQKVPVEATYYAPMLVPDLKNKKKQSIRYLQLPKVLVDFNEHPVINKDTTAAKTLLPQKKK